MWPVNSTVVLRFKFQVDTYKIIDFIGDWSWAQVQFDSIYTI